MRYKNVSTRTLWIRRLGITVKPGDEFDSPHEINDATFEKIQHRETATLSRETRSDKETA